jgi:hypothetical protein
MTGNSVTAIIAFTRRGRGEMDYRDFIKKLDVPPAGATPARPGMTGFLGLHSGPGWRGRSTGPGRLRMRRRTP